jgi:hypothetical protein
VIRAVVEIREGRLCSEICRELRGDEYSTTPVQANSSAVFSEEAGNPDELATTWQKTAAATYDPRYLE